MRHSKTRFGGASIISWMFALVEPMYAVDPNDTVGGGNDTVDGGGNDTIDGGGNDTVKGGDDTVKGGNDTIDGGGNDTVKGGDDTIKGGNDTIDGGNKNSDWSEDWREKMANGDDKLLKRLGRFASPRAVLDSFLAVEKKISSGELRTPLKKDATEDEIKAWRTENGIPDTPEGYEIKLSDGLVLGEDDKPVVESFLKRAHAKNMNADQVNDAVQWYMDMQETAITEQVAADKEFRSEAVEELRKEWGSDYKPNVNIVKAFVDQAPGDLGSLLMGARLADGTLLGDHPAAMRWFHRIATELDPAATVVPNSGSGRAQAIDDEISAIEKRMKEDREGYYKDEKQQARYRELLDVREKINSK